jgi:hypothetical protein
MEDSMKVKLKSKLGRPFWRFEKQLSPDEWTEFDLSDEQLAAIKPQCLMTVAEGGALDIEPNPWAKPAPVAPAQQSQSKETPKGK